MLTVSLRTSEGMQLFLVVLRRFYGQGTFDMYQLRGYPELLARYADGIDHTSPLITHARHRDFLE